MPSGDNKNRDHLQRTRITAASLLKPLSLSFEAIMVLIDACPPFAKCFNSSSRVVLIRGLRLEFRANEWCNHAVDSFEAGC